MTKTKLSKIVFFFTQIILFFGLVFAISQSDDASATGGSIPGQGYLSYEIWTGIGGNSVSYLTSYSNYPNSPNITGYMSRSELSYTNNNYGTRVRGYIYPPVTGVYTFYISGDDESQLWLSSDDSPTNTIQIAHVPSWTSVRQWDRFPEQKSVAQNLVANQKYYVEILHKEGGGGDHLAFAWQTPNNNNINVIDGVHLSAYDLTAVPLPPNCDATSTAPAGTPANRFIVNNVDCDKSDANLADNICATEDGACTLRAAIEQANAMPGANEIHFNIRRPSGSCPSNGVLIRPNESNFRERPPMEVHNTNVKTWDSYVITDDGLTIDAYTQCGASPNTEWVTGNAVLKVNLEGVASSISYAAFLVESDHNVIRGFRFYEWDNDVFLLGASHNKVQGNFMGMKPDGQAETSRSAKSWAEPSILITSFADSANNVYRDAEYNLIGGPSPDARNVIAGNKSEPIHLEGWGVEYNRIENNYVGVMQDGVTAMGNSSDGVDFNNGVSNNWFGGYLLDEHGQPILDANGKPMADPHKRNIVVASGGDGIEVSHGTHNKNNHIIGNWIGIKANGQAQPNGKTGVTLEDQVNHTTVYQNVLAGNRANGIRLYTVYTNTIESNWIGVWPDENGDLQPRPNGVSGNNSKGRSGVTVLGGSSDNIFLRNIIAHNYEYGIHMRPDAGYLASPQEGGYGSCHSPRNTYSQNSIYENGHTLGIRLHQAMCDADGRKGPGTATVLAIPNEGIKAPSIVESGSNTAVVQIDASDGYDTGTQYYSQTTPCANCTIEIFIADQTGPRLDGDGNPTWNFSGEGKTFVGSGTTDASGHTTILLANPVPDGSYLTATATDANGNTSAFAYNRVVQAPTCAGAPAAPQVSIAKSGNDVVISWSAVADAISYNVYQATNDAYFDLVGLSPVQSTDQTSVTIANALGDASTHHYFAVTAVNICSDESTASSHVGEYEYGLTPNINTIAIPLEVSGLTNVSEIASMIGAGNAFSIMKHDAANQTYIIYNPSSSSGDFTINVGDSIILSLTPSAPSLISFVGRVPNAGSIVHTLVPPPSSSGGYFQFLMMPPEKTNYFASNVAQDLGVSSVFLVMKYDSSTQQFISYNPNVGSAGDFEIHPNESFFVSIGNGANTTWPQ